MMPQVGSLKHLLCIGAIVSASWSVCAQDSSRLRDYLQPSSSKVRVFETSCPGSGKGRKPQAIKVRFQADVPHKDGRLVTLSRSDSEEPDYYYVCSDKVVDQNAGYTMLKSPIQKNDEWQDIDPKSNNEIARVKVVDAGASLMVGKKRYVDCVVLLIDLKRFERIEVKTFARGVGLIDVKLYANMDDYKNGKVMCEEKLK